MTADMTALADADLLALFASVGQAVSQRFLKRRPCLTSWQILIDYLNSAMAHRATEEFRVLFLDKRNNLVSDEVMQTGTVDHVPVYPREILRRAIELHACAVIMVHNHPSGDPSPSSADISMTKQVMEAAKLIGIAVHDHIIIGRDGHTSLKAAGLM